MELIAKISYEIEKEIGKKTDIIILNDEPLGLKFEIFKSGKIVYCKDYEEIIEDKTKTMAEYIDFSIRAKPLFEKLIEWKKAV